MAWLGTGDSLLHLPLLSQSSQIPLSWTVLLLPPLFTHVVRHAAIYIAGVSRGVDFLIIDAPGFVPAIQPSRDCHFSMLVTFQGVFNVIRIPCAIGCCTPSLSVVPLRRPRDPSGSGSTGQQEQVCACVGGGGGQAVF